MDGENDRAATFPQVGVDTHVARGPSQALVLPVGDVFFGLGVDVLFGQPEVDDVDCVLPLAPRPPHQKVLRLDVPVYQALGVDVLHPRYLGHREESASLLDMNKNKIPGGILAAQKHNAIRMTFKHNVIRKTFRFRFKRNISRKIIYLCYTVP